MHEVAADTASAVSTKGWKETRLTKDVASSAVEKNLLCMSSASVLESFFSLVTFRVYKCVRFSFLSLHSVHSTVRVGIVVKESCHSHMFAYLKDGVSSGSLEQYKHNLSVDPKSKGVNEW